MKRLAAVVCALFLLAACAATAPSPEAKYEAHCKTHARQSTFSGSPDEHGPYLECMKLEGTHEVEVKKLP